LNEGRLATGGIIVAIGAVAASLIGARWADSPECVPTAESIGRGRDRGLREGPRVS